MKICRALTVLGIALLVAAIAAYAFVRFIVLDEQQLKEKISKLISAHFNRDETEIESLDVEIFSGAIALKNLRIKERYDYHGANPNFLTVPEATISFDRWSFLRSRGRQFKQLNVQIIRPVLIVEREKDGVCNVDDLEQLIATFNPVRFNDGQSCSVTIKDGAIKLIENGAESKSVPFEVTVTASNGDDTLVRFCAALSEIRCPCSR